MHTRYRLKRFRGTKYNLKIDHRPNLMTKLAKWYDMVYKMKLKCFNTVLQTFMNNYQTILNYFDNRSTNASADPPLMPK